MNGAGKLLWGWDSTNEVWIPIEVDANGYLKVDLSSVNLDDLADLDVAAPGDNHLIYWDDAAGKWKARALVFADADKDTKIQVEESPDEDKIRMDVAGNQAFLLSDIGVLTLERNSAFAARGYTAVTQNIAHLTWVRLLFDTEDFDVRSEYDPTKLTGMATATTADHLIDTVNNQFTTADVGRIVWNLTDTTYAKVSAYNSVSDLTLDTDIMANGESYWLYASTFTATEDGKYVVFASCAVSELGDGKRALLDVQKNGAAYRRLFDVVVGGTGYPPGGSATIADLAANDYIQIYLIHTHGATREMTVDPMANCFSIVKMA